MNIGILLGKVTMDYILKTFVGNVLLVDGCVVVQVLGMFKLEFTFISVDVESFRLNQFYFDLDIQNRSIPKPTNQ